MKVAIFTGTVGGGGAERVAVNLANQFQTMGYQVLLLALRAEGEYLINVHSDVEVINFGCRGRHVVRRLRTWIIMNKPHILLSVMRDLNILAALASVRTDVRLVFREASTLHAIIHLNFFKRMLYFVLMRWSYSRAYKVICNSNDTLKDLIDNRVIRKDKCVVIGNPVITDVTKGKARGRHEWFGASNFTILAVGRLHYSKNHDLLVEAFARCRAEFPHVRLIILGDGALRGELLEKIEMLSLTEFVYMPGTVNPTPYYQNCDLFVLTSRWEGFGNVLVEAMAEGLPVISTDCPGGPKEITGNGRYGELVPCNDVEALFSAIRRAVVSNRKSNAAYIESAKRHVSRYSVENIAKCYLKEFGLVGMTENDLTRL